MELLEIAQKVVRLRKKVEILNHEFQQLDETAKKQIKEPVVINLDGVAYQLSMVGDRLEMVGIAPVAIVNGESITPSQLAYLQGLRYPNPETLTKREALIALRQLAKVPEGVNPSELPVSAAQELVLRSCNFWDYPPPAPTNYGEAYARIGRILKKHKPPTMDQLFTLEAFNLPIPPTSAAAHDILAYSTKMAAGKG